MEEPVQHQASKNKFWAGFSTGLLVGLVIAICFYFVDKAMNDPVRILLPKVPETVQTEPSAAVEEEQTPVNRPSAQGATRNKPTPELADSSVTAVADTLFEEEDVEFALEEVAEKEEIYQPEYLDKRYVQVKAISKTETPAITTFEIEEWSPVVKNRISYQRTGNVLKIMGMRIADLHVFYKSEHYYLESNGRYYLIPENSDFLRLQEVQLSANED